MKITVPKSAFTIDDASAESGEEVEFTGRGKIVSTSDETVTLQITELNDAPIAADIADDDEDMMEVARKADEDRSELA